MPLLIHLLIYACHASLAWLILPALKVIPFHWGQKTLYWVAGKACVRKNIMPDNLHEERQLRNKTGIFEDRFDAGDRLARLLSEKMVREKEGMVLAIPSGGVPIGLRISRALLWPMDLIIVRKLQIPWNPEAGFGAMTLDGEVFCNQELIARLGLTPKQIAAQKKIVQAELESRNREFRGGKPFPNLAGKTVVITDDGLASGYTMLASINMTRMKLAGRIVVAVATAPLHTAERICMAADEVYSLHIQDRGASFAVAEAYVNWHDLSREEVREMISKEKT